MVIEVEAKKAKQKVQERLLKKEKTKTVRGGLIMILKNTKAAVHRKLFVLLNMHKIKQTEGAMTLSKTMMKNRTSRISKMSYSRMN